MDVAQLGEVSVGLRDGDGHLVDTVHGLEHPGLAEQPSSVVQELEI